MLLKRFVEMEYLEKEKLFAKADALRWAGSQGPPACMNAFINVSLGGDPTLTRVCASFLLGNGRPGLGAELSRLPM